MFTAFLWKTETRSTESFVLVSDHIQSKQWHRKVWYNHTKEFLDTLYFSHSIYYYLRLQNIEETVLYTLKQEHILSHPLYKIKSWIKLDEKFLFSFPIIPAGFQVFCIIRSWILNLFITQHAIPNFWVLIIKIVNFSAENF